MPAKDLIFTVLGIDRASHVFDDVGKSMDRMSRTGTKSMASLLGASLAAGAGIGAALGGVSILFAGVAAAALSQNAEVAQSFRDLGLSIKTGLLQDAAPLEDEMVGAAESINAAYQELRPQLREAFSAAQPHVESLVEGVTEFAGEAMPGMVTAVESAGPVFDGLEHMLAATGRGVGDFFTVISEGSPAAGMALASLGDLMEGVLPNVGQMLVNLSELWVEHGDQAVRVIVKLTDVVTDLSADALPVVSDAFGVALDVLEGVLAVIGPMTNQLGPLIGAWLAMSLAMRGFGAVRGVVDSATGSVTRLRESMSKGPEGAGKFATAVGGVMGLLGGPWGLAVAGATAMLALFGQESQENAQDQETLAGALKESGGAFDQHARKVLVDSEAFQEVAGSIETAGISQRDFIDAVINGGAELENLDKKLEAIVLAGEKVDTSTGEMVVSHTAQAEAAKAARLSLGDLRAMVTGAQEDFRRNAEAIGGVATSMAGARPGADSLAEAIGILGDKTADTTARADALNTAWRRLLGIDITLEEAMAAFEAGLDNTATAIDRVKKETENWRAGLVAADGQVDVSTEANRQLSANLISTGEEYRALAQTAYDTTLQRTGSEWLATTAAVAAAQKRREQFIAEMRQMGFNQTEAKRLADRYLGLPDDIMTEIRADSSNAREVIDSLIRDYDGRTITIFANAVFTGISNAIGALQTAANVVAGRRASGGPVAQGRPYLVGEEGEEIFWPGRAGTIIPAPATRQFLSSLRAGASVRARSGGFQFESPSSAAGLRGATGSTAGSDDERIVRLLTRALERVSVTLDDRKVGAIQGRHASLLGRTG